MKYSAFFVFVVACMLCPSWSSAQSSSLLRRQAKMHVERGEYAQAAPLFKKAADGERAKRNADTGDVAVDTEWAAFCYEKSGVYSTALQLYREALAFNQTLKYDRNVANLFEHIGRMHFSLEEYDRALDFFNGALNAHLTIDVELEEHKKEEVARIYGNIALVYMVRENRQKALEIFDKALKLNERRQDHSAVATVLDHIGTIYYQMEEYDKALGYFRQAVDLNTAHGRDLARAGNFDHLAELFRVQNNLDEAVFYYTEALEIYQREGIELATAVDYLERALILYNRDGPTSARADFENALTLNRRLGRSDSEVVALDHLGLILYAVGDREGARRHFEDALALNRQLGRSGPEAVALDHLGLILYAVGDKEGARRHFEDALALNRQLGRSGPEAVALDHLGLIFYDAGDMEEALKHFEQALLVNRQLGRRLEEVVALDYLGLIYYALGDYPFANRDFKQALEINRELERHLQEAVALDHLALIRYIQGDFGVANKYFEQALVLNRQLGRKDHEAEALLHLGLIQRRSEEYKKTLELFAMALSIERELKRLPRVANLLSHIARIYADRGKYERAIDNWSEALDVRKEMTRIERDEYEKVVVEQVEDYGRLISAHIREGNCVDALALIETAGKNREKNRWLEPEERERNTKYKEFKKGLRKKTAVLFFDKVGVQNQSLTSFFLTKKRIRCFQIGDESIADLVVEGAPAAGPGVSPVLMPELGVTGLEAPDALEDGWKLRKALLHYGTLAERKEGDTRELRQTGLALYKALLEPLEKHIRKLDELTVVARQDLLDLLPVEALLLYGEAIKNDDLHLSYRISLRGYDVSEDSAAIAR